ncbi:linear amide C-N hydrolase [Enterococcus cecorum]
MDALRPSNCQSVVEVKTAFHNLNVVDIPFNAQMPNTTLHWFVADKKTSCCD